MIKISLCCVDAATKFCVTVLLSPVTSCLIYELPQLAVLTVPQFMVCILLLPLVGVVDSTRTDDVMRKSLAKISETEARIFILDISGVPMVDNAVANQLIKITKATRLMGCETIISGLSPSIAQTMVDLGVEVGQIRTTATLRDALKAGLRSVSAANRHWSDPGFDLTSKDPNSGQTDL